jgi:hypothetical protein
LEWEIKCPNLWGERRRSKMRRRRTVWRRRCSWRKEKEQEEKEK